jgi:nitroimidazol reductase NimA-like FMN-containing flavoprotein (pyridoxamine 5'-phosphate oxidase superfamily)
MRENGPMSANRTTPARMPERVTTEDRDALDRLVRLAGVAHVAFVEDGRPVVMPIAVVPDGDDLLLHGSTGSWWLRRIATGIPVTASVATIDGLVLARSAFESSMRYRSAVLFGSCSPVSEEEKARVLDLVTEGLLPGRLAELRPHRRKELAATMLLRMRIEEWTLKTGTEWPEDDDDDVAGGTWAGVLPLVTTYGAALPSPDLRPGIRLAPSVERLEGAQR